VLHRHEPWLVFVAIISITEKWGKVAKP